jgi:hypothetical protein
VEALELIPLHEDAWHGGPRHGGGRLLLHPSLVGRLAAVLPYPVHAASWEDKTPGVN